ncbi:MAG TPA: GNAT family N-acetyltransferase [Rhizomicrobium sp.]|jgi:aminoglycoside 6'-N-acetyltransferase|nr:GNAT family N-acetyltransferase [Rhizomicrobium sp.]
MPDLAVAFRPLTENDLPWLWERLNRPHLRRFFQREPISLAEVEAKYGARIRHEAPTHCHLALHQGMPFAYIQCYRIADWPDWARLTGAQDGIGIDLAILEPERLGKGLGRAMLGAYVREIVYTLYPGETRCLIAHEHENGAALAASAAVGFRPVLDFVEDGRDTQLLALARASPPPVRG